MNKAPHPYSLSLIEYVVIFSICATVVLVFAFVSKRLGRKQKQESCPNCDEVLPLWFSLRCQFRTIPCPHCHVGLTVNRATVLSLYGGTALLVLDKLLKHFGLTESFPLSQIGMLGAIAIWWAFIGYNVEKADHQDSAQRDSLGQNPEHWSADVYFIVKVFVVVYGGVLLSVTWLISEIGKLVANHMDIPEFVGILLMIILLVVPVFPAYYLSRKFADSLAGRQRK